VQCIGGLNGKQKQTNSTPAMVEAFAKVLEKELLEKGTPKRKERKSERGLNETVLDES